MAVNCLTKIIDPETEFTFLQPNVEYTGVVLHLNDADFFEYEMFENETMFFKIRVVPQTQQPIDMELTLFRIDNEVPIEIGTSYIDQFYNEFQHDGLQSIYRFCIKSRYAIDFTLEVEFTDYPFTLMPVFDMFDGSYMPPIEFARPEFECDAQVAYKLRAGVLPPGLKLYTSGFIAGIPDELDCSTPTGTNPSFTFFEDIGGGGRASISFDFPITIRAELTADVDTFEDRDFAICMRNNWDYDRDAFLEGLPNLERERYSTIEIRGEPYDFTSNGQNSQGESDHCPCPPEPTPKPTVRQLTEEELAILCDVCDIKEEFTGLVTINNRQCVVCEEPEEEKPIELQEIDVEQFCEPCEEPEVLGIRPIPQEGRCPCPVEQESESEAVELKAFAPYKAIPDFCSVEFITRMFKEKVCTNPITCPDRSPIYPTRPTTKYPIASGLLEIDPICGDTC